MFFGLLSNVPMYTNNKKNNGFSEPAYMHIRKNSANKKHNSKKIVVLRLPINILNNYV